MKLRHQLLALLVLLLISSEGISWAGMPTVVYTAKTFEDTPTWALQYGELAPRFYGVFSYTTGYVVFGSIDSILPGGAGYVVAGGSVNLSGSYWSYFTNGTSAAPVEPYVRVKPKPLAINVNQSALVPAPLQPTSITVFPFDFRYIVDVPIYVVPSVYTSLASTAFNLATAQNNELLQRLWGLRVVEGNGLSINGFGEKNSVYGGEGIQKSDSGILRSGTDNHWGMFVDGNGIFAQANAAATIPNYNSQSGGVSVGLSYKWNEHFLSGLYSGYEGSMVRYNDGSQMINNAVRFGLFGLYGQPGGKGFYLMGMAGGTYNQYDISRAISLPSVSVPERIYPGIAFPGYTIPGTNATATSTPGAGELDSMLAGGYDIKKGNFTFGPTTSLQYTFFDAFPITETGAESLNFSSTSWYNASLLYSLGGHLAYTWQVKGNIFVVPQISMSWQHEFLQDPYTINGTSPVPVTSTTPLRDTLYTGVGFTVQIGQNWNTSLFYNASAGNQDLVSQNVFWSAGVVF